MAKAEEKEHSGSGILTKPMDERRRWQLKVRMVIRRYFRVLFGSVFADGCGFFVDRHLSHAVHAFMDWIEYPEGHAEFQGHSSIPYCCAISQDGYHFFLGHFDGTIGVWNLLNLELVNEWRVDWIIQYMDYHSGMLLCGCAEGKISLFNAYTHHLIHEVQTGHESSSPVTSAQFNNDGTLIVSTSSDCSIQLWSSKTGECVKTITDSKCGSVTYACWMVDLIISATEDFKLQVWHPIKLIDDDTKLNYEQSHSVSMVPESSSSSELAVCEILINSDSTRIIVIFDQCFMVFRWPELMKDDDITVDLDCECGSVHPLQPDILAVNDDLEMTVNLYDISDGELIKVFKEGHSSAISTVCFSPDGSRLISASVDHSIRIWDLSEYGP